MQHIKDQLAELRLCLAALPTDIPIPKESKYKFLNFTLDAEWTADIGEAAAVNQELEVRLGSRVNGLKLVERSPEMEAIVHVFETWMKKFPGDVILEKWVNDTLEAALKFYERKPVKVNHTQIPEKQKPKVQKLDTMVAPSVKWRDMYATIHGKPETPLTDKHQGRCSDLDDEDGDWLDNGDIAGHVGLAGVKSTEFDVDKDINISSAYLLDILSDHTLQPTAACGGLSTPKVMAATTSSSTLMGDDEWEEW
ncbi:hypothetical protein DFJ58DRAFT_854912 [Suillus subalutaceus]|uniref:uncharacterized protein n=1 Tax=Suillus subalutaceus TaxID=48586 RepID=UPI001B87425D|nr:uncharacterized protein DFJ58DRAFT_854912 [Suillus subalutaceus]KAG1842743.1 hypothetical protein DFJ58DRAFT_854912 [Suillus subalutaceus]